MKVWVDDQRCRGHGVCVTLCPDVFKLTDDGYAEAIPSDVPQNSRRPPAKPSTAAPSKPSPKAEARRKGDSWSTPRGYVILTEAIKDPEGMKAYAQAAGAAMGGVTFSRWIPHPRSSKAAGMAARPLCWNSSRWMRPARGTSPRPTRRRQNCAKPRPTVTP